MNGCDLKIGSLITTDQQRDAIHVAIAPVEASEILSPGQHVGFVEPGKVGTSAEQIGIVDPFLMAKVHKGQKCWLFMYQNTITSLRHDWTHPAFAVTAARDPEGESRRWIEDFAASIDQTYNRLMEAANLWVDFEEYTYDNSEAYKDRWDSFTEFWKHYEIVTGKKVKDHEASFFTCSC